MKKKLLFIAIVFLTVSLSAKPKYMMDLGRISGVGRFGADNISVCPVLEIPDLYIIGESGLFASLCPFEIEFMWNPQPSAIKDKPQSWSVSNASFINCNVGWMSHLGKNFLIQTYLQFNGLYATELSKFGFTPMVEFSLAPESLDEYVNSDKDIYIPKLLSVRAGVSFYNTNNFKPSFYVSAGLDFIAFAGLAGLINN